MTAPDPDVEAVEAALRQNTAHINPPDFIDDAEVAIRTLTERGWHRGDQCPNSTEDLTDLKVRADRAEGLLAEAREMLGASRRSHYYCDDCWYSCPKAVDGCCDDSKGDECDCGADIYNATVDAFLAKLGGTDA